MWYVNLVVAYTLVYIALCMATNYKIILTDMLKMGLLLSLITFYNLNTNITIRLIYLLLYIALSISNRTSNAITAITKKLASYHSHIYHRIILKYITLYSSCC